MEEAVDRTVWRNHFRGGFGPVVRQNTEWMNESDSRLLGVLLYFELTTLKSIQKSMLDRASYDFHYILF